MDKASAIKFEDQSNKLMELSESQNDNNITSNKFYYQRKKFQYL